MRLVIKITIHSIYWVVFLSFSTLVTMVSKPSGWPDTQPLMPHLVLNTIWAVIVFYSFYIYFIRFFERREYLKYLSLSIAYNLGVTLAILPVHRVIFPDFALTPLVFVSPFVGSFIIAQCGSLVRGFENWFTSIRHRSELENRSLRMELELLKAQVNPHFLFNTLNNIDSLIHTSPSDASRALITVADILRYMIYETGTERVPLQKEIEYIKRYVELQRLRFPKPEQIQLKVSCSPSGQVISPMLLIPFIENAFKFASNSGEDPIVAIGIECRGDAFLFECRNRFNPAQANRKGAGGLGIDNATRRLELLYPSKHKLEIRKEGSTFIINLQIELWN